MKVKRIIALMIISMFVSQALAMPTSITLTTDALGLGGTNINYTGNGSAVEADRPGKLITSTANNIGSVLSIQSDGKAGQSDLLVTITARSHLDIITGLPADHDIYPGVITLTKDSGKDGGNKKRGLGVRAFGLDFDDTSANYQKRYVNPAYTGTNVHGFQMEGSKEVSGGTNGTDWDDYLGRLKDSTGAPSNDPPHVDEDVKFNFNNSLFNINATSIVVIFEEFKFDPAGRIALDIVFTNRGPLSFDDGLASPHGPLLTSNPVWTVFNELDSGLKQWSLDFSGLAGIGGLGTTDFVDYFVIRALDDLTGGDPAETAEHFLINGLTFESTPIPAPSALMLGSMGISLVGWFRRRRFF